MFAGFFICILHTNSLYLPHSTKYMQEEFEARHVHSLLPILAMDRVYKILDYYNQIYGGEYTKLSKIQYMDLAMCAMHNAYFNYKHGLNCEHKKTRFSNIVHAAVHLLMAADKYEYEHTNLLCNENETPNVNSNSVLSDLFDNFENLLNNQIADLNQKYKLCR